MKKTTILLVLGLLLLTATAVWAASVIPTVIPGAGNTDKTCAAVMPGTYELKFDFDENQWSDTGDGSLIVQYTIPSTYEQRETDNSFDWTSNNPVVGVIVKDGVDGANWYDYSPAGSTEDIYLTTPGPPDGTYKAISHISWCYYPVEDFEQLEVSKTAVTAFTRTHNWSIDKAVDPTEFYLYIDGSSDGTATWNIDVAYEGYVDSNWNVSGFITIENTGTLDAVITAVDDVLAGTPIDVYCGVTFPYTLPVGQSLGCSYSKDGYVEGINEVTVTTERDEYFADAAIVWGDPTTEVNKTVTIKDYSDLFGEVTLGTVTAPNDAQFTYTKDFAWADYGQDECGDYTYQNTAKVIGDGDVVIDFATAKLDVFVQCYIYETAYAKGDDAICFIPTFRNWGWTNPITQGLLGMRLGINEMVSGTYEMDLWAGAAQCDTEKGTLVGLVTVVYDGDGYVTVTYNVDDDYILDETHVYADYDLFPKDRRGRYTIAPGQYYNASPFDGSEVHVIAHAVVGMPDPNFGP